MTYRELLLRRFDTADFLGLRRFPEPSELALLSLFLNRSLIDDRVKSGVTTFKALMKLEKDAVAIDRRRLREIHLTAGGEVDTSRTDTLYPRPPDK